jgi:DNA repair exonuclease SbcCD ATPase subunit
LTATLDGERIDSTSRDFQGQLDTLLGMDFKTFTQVAVFGQEVPRVFAEESDAVRKELLESLCGGEQFDVPYNHVKELHESIQTQVTNYNVRLLDLERHTEHLEQDIARCIDERDRWADSQRSRVTSEEQSLTRRETEAREAEAQLSQMETELALVQSRAASFGGDVALNAERARARLNTAAHPVTTAARVVNRVEVLVEQAAESLRLFNDRDAEPVCFNCGQPFPLTEPVDVRRGALEAALTEAEAELASARVELDRVTAERDAAAADAEVLSLLREAQREADGQVTALEAAISHQRQVVRQCRMSRDDSRQRLAQLQGEENRFVGLLQSKEQEMATAQLDRERVLVDKASAEGVLPYLAECTRLFGNQGLKTFLFDSLAPQITNEANRALSILSGGSLSVVVTTERRGRSEKIVLKVTNERGAPSFGGNSGGQKRKVNLAICWAIASLAEGRVNLLFIDEAFDSLDSTAGLRVCDLLEVRGQETGTVIVTSHRSEFRDAFPVVWTARRRGGNSTLEIP